MKVVDSKAVKDLQPSPMKLVAELVSVERNGRASFQAHSRSRQAHATSKSVPLFPKKRSGLLPLKSESNPRPIVVSGAPPRRFSLGMTCPDLRHIRPRTVPASELAPAYGCKHPEKLMEHVIGNRHKSLAWRVTTVALNEQPLLRLG